MKNNNTLKLPKPLSYGLRPKSYPPRKQIGKLIFLMIKIAFFLYLFFWITVEVLDIYPNDERAFTEIIFLKKNKS